MQILQISVNSTTLCHFVLFLQLTQTTQTSFSISYGRVGNKVCFTPCKMLSNKSITCMWKQFDFLSSRFSQADWITDVDGLNILFWQRCYPPALSFPNFQFLSCKSSSLHFLISFRLLWIVPLCSQIRSVFILCGLWTCLQKYSASQLHVQYI